MAIYTFSFDPKYAGRAATVTAHDGSEVTGSPITLDANGDGSLSLPTGTYAARVDNTAARYGDGYSVVNGVFDVEDSIDAAGGGGGAILVGESYTAYVNNGFTPTGDTFNVPWDTVGALPYDSSNQAITLPTSGIYAVSYELDFNAPAESWRWYTQASAIGVADPATPAAVGDLLPGGGTGWQRSAIFGAGVLRVAGEKQVALAVQLAPDPAVGSPTLPTCSFGQFTLTRIV